MKSAEGYTMSESGTKTGGLLPAKVVGETKIYIWFVGTVQCLVRLESSFNLRVL